MKNDSFLERRPRRRICVVAGFMLSATAVLGCDDLPEDVDAGTSPVNGGGFLSGTTGGPGGTTGVLPTPGGGGTTGAPSSPGGGTTGAPSSPGGGTTGGVVTPGGTAGGGNNAAWCKAKAVLDQRCTSCHDGKGTGGSPMALTSAADFLKAAPISAGKTVAQTVSARIHDSARPMPPRDVLTPQELADLDAYIAAGSPAGDSAACAPAGAGGGTTGGAAVWPPPGCDDLVKILSHGPGGANTPYSVPPGQEIHPQIMVDPPWGDETVQAIAFRPITDNARVLHHWILYANNGIGAFLTGWAPGDDDRNPYPPDVGMEMPKGAGSLRLDMHYFSTQETTTQMDQSGVEICIVKGANLRPKPAAVTMGFVALTFPLAPANAVDFEAKGVCEVTADGPVTLLGSGPHAHKLATRTKFWVKKKDGSEILLLDHPFKFGEQGSYPLTPHVTIETGDTVYTSCFYTNPSNRDVNFGQNTDDEMCFNFAAYYPKTANLSCGLGGLIGGLFGGGSGTAGGGGFIGGLFE